MDTAPRTTRPPPPRCSILCIPSEYLYAEKNSCASPTAPKVPAFPLFNDIDVETIRLQGKKGGCKRKLPDSNDLPKSIVSFIPRSPSEPPF